MTVIEPISVADTAGRLTEALIQCYHTISDVAGKKLYLSTLRCFHCGDLFRVPHICDYQFICNDAFNMKYNIIQCIASCEIPPPNRLLSNASHLSQKWNRVRSYPPPRWHWCSIASNIGIGLVQLCTIQSSFEARKLFWKSAKTLYIWYMDITIL